MAYSVFSQYFLSLFKSSISPFSLFYDSYLFIMLLLRLYCVFSSCFLLCYTHISFIVSIFYLLYSWYLSDSTTSSLPLLFSSRWVELLFWVLESGHWWRRATTWVCWPPALLLSRRISSSWLAAWWWLRASWAVVLSSGSREAVCPWWDKRPTEGGCNCTHVGIWHSMCQKECEYSKSRQTYYVGWNKDDKLPLMDWGGLLSYVIWMVMWVTVVIVQAAG